MDGLFIFENAIKQDPEVDAWIDEHNGPVGDIANLWISYLRNCGNDITEILHDGHPTFCVNQAAFAYVDAFKAHANIGFFRGADLQDPEALLEGLGKKMRHVKVRPDKPIEIGLLQALITEAYENIKT